MCLETRFSLLQNEEQVVPKNPENITTASFQFNYAGFKVLTDDSSSGSQDEGHNGMIPKSEVRSLEKRVEEIVPSDKRTLIVEFKANTIRNSKADHEIISSVDIFVEGEILKGIHTAMGCGKDDKLCVKLKAALSGVPASNYEVFSTRGLDYVELLPQNIGQGHDHGKYVAFHLKLNLPGAPLWFGTPLVSWRVYDLNLVIQQSSCNCLQLDPTHAIQLNKKLLEEGLGTDVEIMAKDNVIIPCHLGILIAQSPVIERMLTEGHFVEGATRRIGMPGWTKEEVGAFLAFLYYGGVESAVKDGAMNVALFKMGDYYGIEGLKGKMRDMMMKRSAQLISFILYGVAKLMKDSGLAKKALEALSLRSEEDILGSELFRETFPTEMGRELFLEMLAHH